MTATLDHALPHIVAAAAAGATQHRTGAVDARRRTLVQRSIAGAIAGGQDPLVSALARHAGPGRCELLTGHAAVATPAAAAGIHAAAITVSQCDDGLRESAGHPGLHAFSAAWSVGLSEDVSLSRVLEAYVAGWEVGAQLGLLLGRPRAGIHPHGGWGAASAAVATAVTLGAGPTGVEAAARAALSVALTGPDSTVTDGAASHHLLPALGTANGVTVGMLDLDLADVPGDALSHFASVAHPCARNPEFRSGFDGLLVMHAYTKPIGLCAHALTAWYAATRIRHEAPDAQITSVEVRTYSAAAALGDPFGGTLLARRFSIPWAVAYGLSGRAPGHDDAEMAGVAASVSVLHDPGLDHRYPGARPVRLTFLCADGRALEASVDIHPGDREMPLDDAGEDGVRDALLAAGGRADTAEALRWLGAAPGDTPVRSLAGLFRADDPAPKHSEGTR